MRELSLSAVIKQIRGMDCVKYKIGIFDRREKRMLNKDFLGPDEVEALVPWLKRMNSIGNDIFVTQADGMDRALLLVDDLAPRQIEAMRLRGVGPACVVETSPGNFQAWVSLGREPMPKAERKAAARLLAEQFNGDLASADASHYGRLAGFTNRKDEHLTSAGYPFVLCREADGRDAERSSALRDWARARCLASSVASAARPPETLQRKRGRRRRDPAAVFELYFAQWSRKVKADGKTMDASRGDFAVACRMLKEGYDKEQIALGMERSSPDIHVRKKNHVEDYVARTISAAEEWI